MVPQVGELRVCWNGGSAIGLSTVPHHTFVSSENLRKVVMLDLLNCLSLTAEEKICIFEVQVDLILLHLSSVIILLSLGVRHPAAELRSDHEGGNRCRIRKNRS
jgi:hypothetical protein